MKVLITTIIILALSVPAIAADKSGVDPQVISLPDGPGSIEGLGESFEPELNSGTASYSVKIAVCPGVNGFAPGITLSYNAGFGNSILGLGWRLNLPFIQRQTDKGLPRYAEEDRFILSDLGEMVPLENQVFRLKIEGSFTRCVKKGDQWEAWHKNGVKLFFGETASSRVETDSGIFKWLIERSVDPNGNEMRYLYFKDNGNCFLQEVRYGFTSALSYRSVVLQYEDREDIITDYRSSSRIATAKRLKSISVLSEGRLVRKYLLGYISAPGTKISLLAGITQFGSDGETPLPPLTFQYSPADLSQTVSVSMQNPPQATLSNPEVDLVDIDGDSLPDILHTPPTGHEFYLNRGNGAFNETPIQAAISPSRHLSTDGILMGDLNGDGLADLIVQTTPDFGFFKNEGKPWEKEAGWIPYGIPPPFSLENPDTRLVDLNNDGLMDVVFSRPTDLAVYLNDPVNPWTEAFYPSNPGVFFSSAYVKFADMNGDGMQDLVSLDTWGFTYYLPNMGFGRFGDEVFMGNSPNLPVTKIQDGTVLLMDTNSDGLSDLVQVDSEQVTVWLNQGNESFSAPVEILNTPAFQSGPPALRQADMDGNGCKDLLFSFENAAVDKQYQYLDFSNGAHPNLLIRIDNGLGMVIEIDFKSSTEDYLAAAAAGTPWETSLPFPVQVVGRRTVKDKNSGQAYVTEYVYRDGYYDGDEREFRGFASVDQIERDEIKVPTLISRHRFDVGAVEESRKGMLLEKSALKEGGTVEPPSGMYQLTQYELDTRTLSTGTNGETVRFSFMSRKDAFLFEDTTTPKQLRSVYYYDEYGNEINSFIYGEIEGANLAIGKDEILTTTEYYYWIDQNRWMVDRPKRITQTDLDGGFVSDTRNTYDDRGNLTMQEKSPQNGTWISVVRNEYDDFGNIIKMTDANNHSRTMGYDPAFHTFPVSETLDQLGLTMTAAYDTGFGKITSFTHFNGHTTGFGYDVFGRLIRIIKPGDSYALPTQGFEYHLSDPVSHVKTSSREISGEAHTYDVYAYYDGLGRKLQVRSEAENGLWVVSEAVVFNQRQLEKEKWLPYFANLPSYGAPDPEKPRAAFEYDPVTRSVKETNPDSTFRRTEYLPLQQRVWDEEDNRTGSLHENTPHTFTYDGLERLIKVQEKNGPNTYQTEYEYDGLNNLVHILDDHWNIKTMIFDGLGRKTYMNDPDKGEMQYTYDDVGNLLQTVDNKAQVVSYTYDAANRILIENHNGVRVRYHYDGDHPTNTQLNPIQNTLGRLSHVEDGAGQIAFTYNQGGNVKATARQVNGYEFMLGMTYDAMDRITRLIYPDGETAAFRYNGMNRLERIPGYVNNINYGPSGQKTSFQYANGVGSVYSYDILQRLKTLVTKKDNKALQDLSYGYDHISNITAITDGRQNPTPESRTRAFQYDDLYRLTRCTSPTWHTAYGYDTIGNLTSKTSNATDQKVNLGNLTYGFGSAGPHAVTSAGPYTYTYDQNGNIQTKTGQNFTFNYKDRMTHTERTADGTTATYRYDYQGNRVTKQVTKDGKTETTFYIDRFAEVRGDELIEHVFADDRRVADIRKFFSPDALVSDPTVLEVSDFDTDHNGQISLQEIKSQGSDPNGLEIPEVRDAIRIFREKLGGAYEPITFGTISAAVQGVTPEPAPMEKTTHFYIPDHLGSASIMTDNRGNVVEESVYYPYGMHRARTGIFEANYRFTGKELDTESDLMYFEARYYDAMVGRFVSVDPLYASPDVLSDEKRIEFLETTKYQSLYSYASLNPIVYYDANGLESVILLKSSSFGLGVGHSGILIEKAGKLYYFSKGSSDASMGSLGVGKAGIAKSNKDYLPYDLVIQKSKILESVNRDFRSGDDGKPYDDYLIYKVSLDEANDAFDFANSSEREKEKYSFFSLNCKDFVRDILSEANINTSYRMRPNAFFNKAVRDEFYNRNPGIKVLGSEQYFSEALKTN